MHPSEGAQKNILKAWNCAKINSATDDNNLLNIFLTNVSENGTGQILLIVVLMVGLCVDN